MKAKGVWAGGLIAAMAFCALPSVALAQFNDGTRYNVRTIRVTGQGEVRVRPNIATVRFAVETVGSTAEEASQANATAMDRVLNALLEEGVPRSEIRTEGYNVYPEYAPDRVPGNELQPPRIRGYRAMNMVVVRTRDLDEVGSLIDVGLKAGANRLSGVGFQVENADAVESEALTAAVLDARRQAETMAAALGVRLGNVIDATTSSQPVRPFYRDMAEGVAMAASAPTPIEPGEQTVNAMASLVFAIE